MDSRPPQNQTSSRERSDIEAALADLRLRLLDLSLRNRLLNFKHTAGRSLQFVEGHPLALFQRLIDAPNRSAVTINGLPEPARGDWVERNGRLAPPDPREWAKQKGIPTSHDLGSPRADDNGSKVRALYYPEDLAKHCRKLEREAVSAMQETGANMLFLVLGFLEFPDQRDKDKRLLAPLINVPVLLSKAEAGGRQTFSLQYTGDDVTDNLCLREKLKIDYGLIIPEIDDEQVDPESYFKELEGLIQNRPGFAVRRFLSLCMLSFTNMLLVRDLEPTKWPSSGGQNGLLDHPTIRQVFEGAKADGDGGPGLGEAPEYDVEEGPAHKLALVFDADSSQHFALADVLLHKKNLVIEGPPGTGKSQTITNLIAAAMAEGKKVLFVAEKLAALEVVKTRLTAAGLDPFVLELHSNKSNKKRVLEEIERRLGCRISAPADLPHKIQLLERHRDELRSYQTLINSIIHNSFGLTLHQIMWRAEKFRLRLTSNESAFSQILVADAAEISEAELSRRADILDYLGKQYSAIGGFDAEAPFWGFMPDRIIPGDEVQITDAIAACLTWAEEFGFNCRQYNTMLGGASDTVLTAEKAITQLSAIAKMLTASQSINSLHLIPRIFSIDPTGARARHILEGVGLQIERYHKLAPVVSAGLLSEEAASEGQLSTLRAMREIAGTLGLTLGTPTEIETSTKALAYHHSRLVKTLAIIEEFCERKGILFDGSPALLEQLLSIASLIKEMPFDLFRLQQPGMLRVGSDAAIESLLVLQRQWMALQQEMEEFLYTDMLPDEPAVRAAIGALREHSGWAKVLKQQWRDGMALHKRISRSKKRMRPDVRLAQLEQVASFHRLQQRWRSDAAWQQHLGTSAPDEPIPLDQHLTLARWNAAAREILEAMPAPLFSLDDLTREKALALKREFELVSEAAGAAAETLDALKSRLPNLAYLSKGLSVSKSVEQVGRLILALAGQIGWLREQVPAGAILAECERACEAALDRTRIVSDLDSNREIRALLGEDFAGTQTNIQAALIAVELGQSLDRLPVPAALKEKLRRGPLLQAGVEIQALLTGLVSGFSKVDELAKFLRRFGAFDPDVWIGRSAADGLAAYADALETSLLRAVEESGSLVPWSLYVVRRKECLELGLEAFVGLLEARSVVPRELSYAYSYCAYVTVIRNTFRLIPQLGRFTGLRHDQVREEFRRLDHEVINIRGKAIAAQSTRSCAPPPGHSGTRVDDKTEMALLNHLMPQQRPRVPVRKMIYRAGRAIQSLKPCFMMGPQAVAQYLPPGAVQFDLVIMDEASQLKPEEAIGAIARGAQLVVVGDSKQLPPTSFFSMGPAADGDGQFSTDAESILDVCAAHFRPSRSLRWHYRSQHHSLIAFSNYHFYRGGLIVFPSPYGQSGKLGVRATYLADAIYENQTNLREAERVVGAAIEHILDRPDDSLGIVTLNMRQRDLIAELLDERLRHVSGADAYRERWMESGQPLFVKNLENVQGDERDAIVVSTTFGKPPGASVVRQNFGPISRQGGWRRLNVLFTRARKSVAVYTSMRPEDIVDDPSTPEGTKALRNYLEYARSGSLIEREDRGHEPDSDFEVAVINVLKARGYEVTPQLGVAGFRIDIAVKHPKAPGTYLAAIECDGATYHSARSVRDRDRIRQEILESLGWRGRIWRIWSTDWFRAPRQEIQKLISFLEDAARTWLPEHASGESWVEEGGAPLLGQAPGPEAAAQTSFGDVLVESGEDIEVRTQDTVRYVDIEHPEDVLTVQISSRGSDLDSGVVGAATPLAQALLGAVAGDEVQLHLPGKRQRTFRILGITR